jgi:hypothetical protein
MALAVLLWGVLAATVAPSALASPPNILFFIIDDLGWNGMSERSMLIIKSSR